MGKEILAREPVSPELGPILEFVSDFKVSAWKNFCLNYVVRVLSEGKAFLKCL